MVSNACGATRPSFGEVACEVRDKARELKQMAAPIRAKQLRGALRHFYVK